MIDFDPIAAQFYYSHYHDRDLYPAVEEEDEYVNVGGATEVKLFGKWSFDDIEIRDISLEVNISTMIVLGNWFVTN